MEVKEKPHILTEIDDELSMISLVSKNFGYAITPMKNIYTNQDVLVLPISNPNYKRTIYMVTRKDINEREKLKQFKLFTLNDFKFEY